MSEDSNPPGPTTSTSEEKSETPTTSEAPENPEKKPEDGGEDLVTMLDVLEDEQALEEDAQAVLGGADAQNCTYLAGAMKRQPLYSCLTCLPLELEGENLKHELARGEYVKSVAGICLACSYQCHEGHNMVELYTKRNFRCDCGNEKFPNKKCKLESSKQTKNNENRYNQNFIGVYCICHRPYPDPEDPIPDEMIQCVVCEDWFHGRHLGMDKSDLPNDNSYAEMVCNGCVNKFKFLMAYKDLAVNLKKPNVSKTEEKEDVDVVTNDEKQSNEAQNLCPVKQLDVENSVASPLPSLFFSDGWRTKICKCSECDKNLSNEGLEFLTDPEDTVHHYESKSKRTNEDSSSYDEGMKALGEIDRVQQVEIIDSYNQMKNNLKDFLEKFASNGKVVKQEDIQEFFQTMRASKRRKVEIPKFCR